MKPLSLNPRQRRIEERLLRLVSAGAAAFFRDSCRHMDEPSQFDSTAHQVGHLLREIESALRDVLQALAPTKRGGDGAHEKAIRLILRALEIDVNDPVAVDWLRHRGLHRLAHRSSLQPARKIDQEFRALWEDMQAVFDVVLGRFEKRFVEVRRRVDDLVATDQPSKADVDFLRKSIPDNLVGHGYFFDKLQNPSWISVLEEAGFFSDPPASDLDDLEVISSPPWPAGNYLARIATVPDVQGQVLEILLRAPDTRNASVHETIARAALGMTPPRAAQLAVRLKGWFSDNTRGFFRQIVADLIVALSDGGQVEAAFSLATELFAVVPPDVDKPYAPGHARGGFDDFEYHRLLAKCRPALMAVSGSKTIDFLCALLERALGITADRPDADHSAVWRQSIESDADHRPWSVQGALVSGIRDCVREAASSHPEDTEQLVNRLDGRGHPIFRRLALDLLAQNPVSHLELVEERLMDTSRWDSTERHEYAVLVRAAFPHVSDRTREAFLAWIAAGPPEESLDARWESTYGSRPSDEQRERHRRTWQRDRLAPIKDVLPIEWKTQYAELVEAVGEPDHPDFAFFTRSWIGPTSPTAANDLAALGIEQVVRHLDTWKAPSDWGAPSVEGLGRQLAAAVAKVPDRFASAAVSFKGLDATYVRSLFTGLRDGLGAGKPFKWDGVLALAEWVIA